MNDGINPFHHIGCDVDSKESLGTDGLYYVPHCFFKVG